jgi:hypothetical protein
MRSNVLTAAAVAAMSSSALAAPVDYTVVNRSSGGGQGHRAILSSIYSGLGGFTRTDVMYGGTNFKGSASRSFVASEFTSGDGSLVVRRVQDRNGSGLLNIGNGPDGADDQQWEDGTVRFRAEVKRASDNSLFGFIDDANGSVATVVGNTGNTGVISPEFNMSTSFRWFLNNRTQKTMFTSAEGDNDARDHLVTYEVTGLGAKTYLLFWEDRGSGDFDYNDSVIQLRLVGPDTAMVPLPTAGGEAEIRRGGGDKAIARQHAKKRLTARERVEKLIDPGGFFQELGLWAAFGMYPSTAGPRPRASSRASARSTAARTWSSPTTRP